MTKRKLGLHNKHSNNNNKNKEITNDSKPAVDKRKRLRYAAGGTGTLAVIVATVYMLMMPGVTMSNKPECGLEEHVHTDSCYSVVEVTDSADTADTAEDITDSADVVSLENDSQFSDESLSDTDSLSADETADSAADSDEEIAEDTDSTEIAEDSDSDTDTVDTADTEDITVERVLTCGKTEHTHTDSCYPNGKGSEDTDSDTAEENGTDADNADDTDNNADTNTDSESESTADSADTQENTDTNSDSSSDEESDEAEITGEAEYSVSILMPQEMVTEEVITNNYMTALQDDKLILVDTGDNKDISKMVLSYKCPDSSSTDWAEVTSDVSLHGDDSLKLYLEYKNISIADLKAHNYTLYYPLPNWMENADDSKSSDLLDENSKSIGKITAKDGYLVAAFTSDWVNSLPSSASTISGNLSMEAQVSADYIKSSTVKIGDITVNVAYEAGKWECEYGTLDIAKSKPTYVEKDDGFDLMVYTLTVKTGATDMTAVKVVDAFNKVSSNDGSYDMKNMIKEMVGITDKETAITNTVDGLSETSTLSSYNPGTIVYDGSQMTWNIGDMQANETRTLTYTVKLKREYTGISRNNKITIANVAKVYSDEYQHGSASSTFDVITDMAMYKGMVSYVPDEDGVGGTITYYIKIEARDINTYTIQNLKIFDYYSNEWYNYVGAVDVKINTDSFRIYNGDATNTSQINSLTKSGSYTTIDPKDIKVNTTSDGKFENFTCYFGDFKPSQHKTLVYSVSVNDSYYTANNGSFTLRNRAQVYNDDTRVPSTPKYNRDYLKGVMTSNTITYSTWEKKYSGTRVEKKQTIPINDTVYEETDSGSVVEPDINSFTVRPNDNMFRVVVNQYGLLDVNAVTLKDTLAANMKYTGYLKVEAYDSLKDVDLSDSTALDSLKVNPVGTSWLDIDGLTTFSFKPEDLGFNGNHAYILTYYTRVDYDGSALYIDVSNSFNLTGYASGTSNYYIGGLGVSVTTQVSTSSACQVEKTGWYYEHAKVNDTSSWSKGDVLWYIRITGTDIPKNMVLKDVINDTDDHVLDKDGSVVGLYMIDLDEDLSLYKYDDFNADTDTAISAELVDSSNYTLEYNDDGSELQIKFTNKLEIPDDKAYVFVLKTKVTKYPTYGNTIYYQNTLYQQINGGDFQKTNATAEVPVVGYQSTIKEVNEDPFIFDGTYCWHLSNPTEEHNAGNHIYTNYKDSKGQNWMMTEPGVYMEYSITTCRKGSISGDVEFSDILPKGMEIEYFRNGWFRGNSDSNKTVVYAINAEIPELENEIATNPKTKWKRYETTDKLYCNSVSGKCIYYYNSQTREIRWKLSDVNVNNSSDSNYANFQLLVRITDEELLLGVDKKTYVNSVDTIQDGRLVETDSCSYTMGRSTITKGIVEEEEAGNLVPFKIVVNTTSEDLLSESKTITLVDRMSADLRVNLDSIVVKGKDDQELTDIKVGYERTDEYTYIKFTIPDDQKVTITYDTVVTSAPGKTVTLSNDAYWEGYEPTESSSVSQQYSYNFEGVASADGYANLKLTKVDASDITKKLSGAEYSMQEVQVNSDGTYTLVGDAHTGTTDENGVIYFSNDDDATKRWMKFDTIYAITETKAPDGYYLDTTPHYIVLATQENTTDYPDKVEVVRNKSLYEFEASDKRMYALPKAGGMGVSKLQITGVLLLAMAAGYVSVRTLRNYRRRLNG